MKLLPITLWYSVPKRGVLEYNHWEEGHVRQKLPTPSGGKTWSGAFERKFAWRTNETTPKIITAHETFSTLILVGEPNDDGVRRVLDYLWDVSHYGNPLQNARIYDECGRRILTVASPLLPHGQYLVDMGETMRWFPLQSSIINLPSGRTYTWIAPSPYGEHFPDKWHPNASEHLTD